MTFFADAVAGLTASPKWISPKYFYDARGSHYFDLICKLDEYYPYRTEMALLPRVAKELDHHLPSRVVIVEFGAGSLHKVRPLLASSRAIQGFIPIDISAEHLTNAGKSLQKDFPNVEIRPATGDFTQPLDLPQLNVDSQASNRALPRLGFFPGSTIGNFSPANARSFLLNARHSLGPNSLFLLGVDTQQDVVTLERAYNDTQGITAAFNKNLLVRMNRELNTNFEPNNFTHRAYFNQPLGRIEMHLISDKMQQIQLGTHTISLAQGESIHTENSYKYTPTKLQELVESAGWTISHKWQSPDGAFSEVLLRHTRAAAATVAA